MLDCLGTLCIKSVEIHCKSKMYSPIILRILHDLQKPYAYTCMYTVRKS